MVKKLDIGADLVRVSLIEFSNTAKLVFPFNRYSTTEAVQRAVIGTRKTGGGTHTHLALKLASDTFFNSGNGMQ